MAILTLIGTFEGVVNLLYLENREEKKKPKKTYMHNVTFIFINMC